MRTMQSDEQLIDQFLAGPKDDSEIAFEILVERYGPMVLRVCRRVLRRDPDAEDAFQATFLALARKVGTIRDRRMLASWLQEVAFRSALRERARANRDRATDPRSVAMSVFGNASGDSDELVSSNDLRPVLYEEINELPEKYGVAVILGYLEGKSNSEVADLLKWPVGTVKGRLSRARDMLRTRLSRRGFDPEDVCSSSAEPVSGPPRGPV
jgi:RNA polymerase sigma factor (sigma-70 family)